MKPAAVGLAVALAAVSARAQHDHGAAQPPKAEHEHAPSPPARPAPSAPSRPPASGAPRPSTPVPDAPVDQFERFRRENPALGAKMDEFLSSVSRDNPGSTEQALELALQIGGALDKIEKLKASAAAGKIDKGEFKSMKAEALEGVSSALHVLMEVDDSNGQAMRAVHKHFDGPLKSVGFDVGRHAKDMYGVHPGGFTGRYLAAVEQDAGRWPQAVEYAKQSLRYEPKNPQALGIIARGLYEQGDYAGANEAAKAALAIDRADPVANSIAGLTRGRTAPTQAVAESAGASPQVSPAGSGTAFFSPGPERVVPPSTQPEPGVKEAAALAEKAHAYLRVGDKSAAIGSATKALSLEPGHKRASLALGAALVARGEYLKALAVLQEALKAAGGRDPDLLTASAGVLNRLRRFDEALASADLALRVDPTKAAAHLNRAWALSGMGRDDEALAALAQGAKYDPGLKALYDQAMRLAPDDDLFAFLSGERPAAKAAVPAKATMPGMHWGVVAALALAGLVLVVFGVTRGGARHGPGSPPA